MEEKVELIFITDDDDLENYEQRLEFMDDEPDVAPKTSVTKVMEEIERKVLKPQKQKMVDVFVKNKDSCTSVSVPRTTTLSDMEKIFADDEKVNIYKILQGSLEIDEDDIVFPDGRVGKKLQAGAITNSDGDFFEIR